MLMNALYGIQIKQDINEFHKRQSQNWMETADDDNNLEYWKLSIGNLIVKMKNDDG